MRMLPTIAPLRLVLAQFFCILLALMIDTLVLSQRAELPRRMSAHYAIAMNAVSIVIGWLTLFGLRAAIFNGARKEQLLSYIFTGQFLEDQSMVSTQFALCVALALLFIGGFIIKPQSIYILQGLEILPQPPGHDLDHGDLRLHSLVQERLRENLDGAIRFAHLLGTLATLAFFILASSTLWLT